MGFTLRCAIVACDDAEQGALASAMRETLPFVDVRHMDDPFTGVIAACFYQDVFERYEAAPDHLGIADEDTAYDQILYGVEGALPALSTRFPQHRFGYIDVDCFGGVCRYSGHVVHAGVVGVRVDRSEQDGHQQILQAMGHEVGWAFTPFTREFWRGEASGPHRRPISCTARGTITHPPFAELAQRLPMLLHVAGWTVPIAGDTAIIFVRGADDVALSINVDGAGAVTIGGRAHCAPPEAIDALDDLLDLLGIVGAACEIQLVDLGGTPIRAWVRPSPLR